MLRPLPRLRVTPAARRRRALVASGSASGRWQALQTGVRVPQDGTIEVTAGTSGTGEAVYFDNLRVEQTGGLLVQEQHPYAYGAPLPGLSYTVGTRRYRYGYQGQYAEHDDETGFESFELRLYNSRVGRWLSYDPEGQFDSPYVGMGNNPVSGVDPDGGFSVLDVLKEGGPKFRAANRITRSGLSAGARIGLQVTSSALRTIPRAFNLGPGNNILPIKHTGIVDIFPSNISATFGANKKFISDYQPGGERYPGDGIEPSYIFEDSIIGIIFFKPIWALLGPPPLIASGYGRLIGWGEGQSAEAVQQTINVTENLTAKQVGRWARKGLSKDWVEENLESYNSALAKGGIKVSKNAQLVHRQALMEKTLKLWPRKN